MSIAKTPINTTYYIKNATITSYVTRLVLYTPLFLSFAVHLILLELEVGLAT
jgi:hypothetical protein